MNETTQQKIARLRSLREKRDGTRNEQLHVRKIHRDIKKKQFDAAISQFLDQVSHDVKARKMDELCQKLGII